MRNRRVVGDSAVDPHDCGALGAAQHHRNIVPWITSWGKGQNLEFIVWFLVNVQCFYTVKSKTCKWNRWVLYCSCNKRVGSLSLNLLWDLPWWMSHSDLIVIQEQNCFVPFHLCEGGFPGASGIRKGRSPGEGNSNPLQSSCLENPMDKGACRLQSKGSRVRHDLVTKPPPSLWRGFLSLKEILFLILFPWK